MRSALRRLIEGSPALAASVRAMRDEWRMQRSSLTRTSHGFLLGGNSAMEQGTFEPEEVALFSSLLPECDVFIDVGANVGLYACLALRAGKHVLAVEPLHDNVRYLCRNIEANGWTAEVWPVGLSSKIGIASLYGASTGASLLPGWSGVSTLWRRPIPLTTLDALVAHRFSGERVLVKIDVEGAELEVLRGARKMIERAATWVVEITLDIHRKDPNPFFSETFSIFRDAGYSCFTASPERRRVAEDDVRRWACRGRVDFGNGNWLFTR